MGQVYMLDFPRKNKEVSLSLHSRSCIEFLNLLRHRMMLTGPDRKVVFANRAAAEVPGCGRRIRGMRCYNVIHGTRIPSEHCARCSVYEGGTSGCSRMDLGCGNGMLENVRAFPLTGPDSTVHHILYVFNSTEGEAESLRKAFDARILYARGVLHDLNNLLASIQLNAGLAKIGAGGDLRMCGMLDSCLNASGKSAHLIRNLMSCLSGGSVHQDMLHSEPVDIKGVIEESADLFLRESGIAFTLRSNLENGLVRGDRLQLFQLFSNLFINAREAKPKVLVVNVTLSRRTLTDGNPFGLSPGKYAEIAVADNGCGIAREHIGHIFDPYFTMKKTGSGLGLSICRRIALGHGGAITVSSEPSSGTVFTVLLPAWNE